MTITAIIGSQWGDEGKGKLVDALSSQCDGVARFNGGANAGHTIVANGAKFALHLLPCGVLYPGTVNIIGNGTVIHIPSLLTEMTMLKNHGIRCGPDRIKISSRAHLLFDFYQVIDSLQETRRAEGSLGTTKRGIGPCYASKATRDGMRICDLAGDWERFQDRYLQLLKTMTSQYQFEYGDQANAELKRFKQYRVDLLPYITDTVVYIAKMLSNHQTILAEGANAALLDVDCGTYPFVTSSTTTIGGVCTGLGVSLRAIRNIIGVAKSYTTRVGAGPFPTEILDSVGLTLRDVGQEFGTTTKRPRRCGWLDIPLLKYSNHLNGYDALNLTKLDVLTGIDPIMIGVDYVVDGIRLADGHMPSALQDLNKVVVVYEKMPGWKRGISQARTMSDLPDEAQAYIRRIQELLGIPIKYIGVGPDRDEFIVSE